MLELPEEELKKFIDIDDYNLGWWKLESKFTKARFIRQKCYIEENEISEEEYNKKLNDEDYNGNIYTKNNRYYELNTTIAGLPKNLGKYINFDNFRIGFSINKEDKEKDHKLTYKHVKGGVMLVDTDFTIN